jgi:hypothetical protein
MMGRCFVLIVLALPAFGSDLVQIRTEPNLERRAHLALEHAYEAFNLAKDAYANGDSERTSHELLEMQASVEVARDALNDTGKDPRRHAKHFKMAELESSALLRRIDGLENSMDVDDRKIIEGPKAKVEEVHEEWLNGIITGRR